jgi:GntR family transcriptional regulator
MHSDLTISHADRRPMYLQIMEQIRHRVAIGDWKPGHELPSIRALAVATQVSVITVKRAYLELERGGVIVTRQGKGSFVAEDVDLSTQLRRQGSMSTSRARRGRAPTELSTEVQRDAREWAGGPRQVWGGARGNTFRVRVAWLSRSRVGRRIASSSSAT